MNPDKLEIEYLRTALDLEKKKVDGLNQIIERLLASARQTIERTPKAAEEVIP